MPSLRCNVCQIRWPDKREWYATCPQCGDTTHPRPYEPATITAVEAQKIWAHRQFELYLLEHGDKEYDPEIDEHAERTLEALRLTELQHALEMIPTRPKPGEEVTDGDSQDSNGSDRRRSSRGVQRGGSGGSGRGGRAPSGGAVADR